MEIDTALALGPNRTMRSPADIMVLIPFRNTSHSTLLNRIKELQACPNCTIGATLPMLNKRLQT